MHKDYEDLKKRADPHLGKLTLGRFFEPYDATWSGEEARDFRDVLIDLCAKLDHIGPARLDAICDELQSGLHRLKRVSGAKPHAVIYPKDSSYLALMGPNIDLLDRAYKYRQKCQWKQKGCHAMYMILQDLIFKNGCVLPYLARVGRL